MKTKSMIDCLPPPNPRTIGEQLDFTMQWHLDKALAEAIDIRNEPIRANLLLLRSHLQEIRKRLG